MEFRKALAKYYQTWYNDCLDSAQYCRNNGDLGRAREYLDNAEKYAKILDEHKEAIEFFSQGDNAFLLDGALPEKFRGYK